MKLARTVYAVSFIAIIITCGLYFGLGPVSNIGKKFAKLKFKYLPEVCFTAPTNVTELRKGENNENKSIVLWTYKWSSRNWGQAMGAEVFKECSEKRCELTTDRCKQPSADAVLFYMPSFEARSTNAIPLHHPHNQVWALMVFESEVTHDRDMTITDGIFNWTISHKFDSDISMAYNYFFKVLENPARLQPLKPKQAPPLSLSVQEQKFITNYNATAARHIFSRPAQPNINYAQNKTKFALWYVSNCHTGGTTDRIKLFHELRKYIPIDAYGKHGTCSPFGVKDDPCGHDFACSAKVMSQYKFYLSFENSHCNYYMTEKFFLPLRNGILPIAFGAPLEHYKELAPVDSFLHVDNFTSTKDLANYMIHLNNSDTSYNRYMKWRESHVYNHGYFYENNFHCKFCEDLWNKTKKHKTYKLSDWWNKDKNCKISTIP